METQTDGVEWVLATLFCLGILAVVAAAVREIRQARRGDPGTTDSDPKRRHSTPEP
jgi:hypothetical protein